MNLKRGITVTMMVVTVILMIILAGTITISTYSTINNTRLSTWVNEITYVQDVVNEQIKTESAFDKVLETVTFELNSLTSEEIQAQFAEETISDTNTVELQVLDVGKLGITNVSYGNGKTTNDVYAISPVTFKVYYLEGVMIDNAKYYTLTEDLKNKFKLESANSVLKSVVFVPSIIGYTNEPIEVTVKIPTTFTNIAISTSDSQITVGSQTTENNMYIYEINSNNIATNYTVTVTYNLGTQTKTVSYKVTGYDNIKPVISDISDKNFVYKQTNIERVEYLIDIKATDESGIKYIKYDLGTISETDAYEHFKENGSFVIGGKINLDDSLRDYTIYAEDNAGNFSVVTFKKPKLKTLITTEAELLAALASGESNIKLAGNIECTAPITISGNHQIDLNGNTFTYNISVPTDGEEHTFTFITIEEGSSLVIRGNGSGEGKIQTQMLEETYNGNKGNRENKVYTIQNKGTLTLESGAIINNVVQNVGGSKKNISIRDEAKAIINEGTLNINGGEIAVYVDAKANSHAAMKTSEALGVGIMDNGGTINLNAGSIIVDSKAGMGKTLGSYGYSEAYAYGITTSDTTIINRADGFTISVNAETYDNENTIKETEEAKEII